MRNRRWKHRLGPLIIYAKNDGIAQSVRNIRGVDFCNVYSLNLLKLAPGGHIGRLIIWTEDAFRALNAVYGNESRKADLKKNYRPPRPIMMNSDLNRIINSQEIQSAINPKRKRESFEKKRNPLKHPDLYAKLNPLFDQQWQDQKKNYKDDTKPRTTRVLKPLRKKQRVMIQISKEEKFSFCNYNIFSINLAVSKRYDIFTCSIRHCISNFIRDIIVSYPSFFKI